MLLRLAYRNLRRNRLRSVLAVLGILIGVLVISSVGIFGTSIKHATTSGFEGMTDTAVVTPNFQEGVDSFDRRDVQSVRRVPGVVDAVPIRSRRGVATLNGEDRGVTVYGLPGGSLERLFTFRDGAPPRGRGSAALGSTVAEATRGVGSDVALSGRSLRVSGVLREAGFTLGVNPNDAVFLDEATFRDLYGDTRPGALLVTTDGDAADAASRIETRMNRKEDRVRVVAGAELVNRVNSLFDTISLFLVALAGVSLLVAGVSILNVMLMSTVERTSEIGVMKAVGGSRGEILRLFLAEAALLGAVGSAAGTGVSLAVGTAAVHTMMGDASVALSAESLGYVALGGVFGLLSAVAAGVYPAWRASRMDPVEALRHE